MTRYVLIRQIFNSVSEGNKGLDKKGRHVVHLAQQKIPMYATLEKLSNEKLQALAKLLGVRVEREEVA